MTTPAATTSHRARGPGTAARTGHYGAWRAVAAVPAMVGSLLLLLVLFGWLGRWEGLVLTGWLAAGVAIFTRVGERVAVTACCRWHRPSIAQAALVEPAWTAALDRAGISRADVDLYVQRSADLNLYALGGRSVAVTRGVLSEFAALRLGQDQLIAALIHELGHVVTPSNCKRTGREVAGRTVAGCGEGSDRDRDGDPRTASANAVALTCRSCQRRCSGGAGDPAEAVGCGVTVELGGNMHGGVSACRRRTQSTK